MTSTVVDRLDGVSTSLAIKAPVRVATTANITLSGLQTIDGVALATGDRVLVKDQTVATQNGIYDADTSTWSRAVDFDGNRDLAQGTLILVTDGTVGSNTYWRITTANPIVVDTSSIAFARAIVSDGAVVSFVASGTGATTSDVQTILRLFGILPQQFGAAADGVTNDYTALVAADTAAQAQGKDLLLYGTYAYGTPWVPISANNRRILALGKTKLLFTGTGKAVTLDGGTVGSGIDDFVFGGASPIEIEGNPNCTDGLFMRAVHHSDINVRVSECTSAAFRTEWCVLTKGTLVCSNNEVPFTNTPAYGLYCDLESTRGGGFRTAACDFHVIMEGPVIGVYLQSALVCHFTGTCEGGVDGVIVATDSYYNTFDNEFYLEANSGKDLGVLGHENVFTVINTDGGDLQVKSGALGNTFIGSRGNVNVNAGALCTKLIGHTGTITDNATAGQTQIIGRSTFAGTNASSKLSSLIIGTGSNALTFYDSLTWTPVMSGSGTAGTPTHSVQSGSYQKFGLWVIGRFAITISAKGGMVGNIQISLPAAAVGTGNHIGGGAVFMRQGITETAGITQLGMEISPSASVMHIRGGGAGATATTITDAEIADATIIRGTFAYIAAA